jgi:hypothetical protein
MPLTAPTDLSSLIALPAYSDARGLLVAIEGTIDVPFSIARAYYIVAAEGARRGCHAHRTLEQVAVCITGSCRMLLDDATERREVLLDRPDQGLYIGPMRWREIHDFSEGCALLVLASAHHDEADYIRDYPAFLAEAQAQAAS